MIKKTIAACSILFLLAQMFYLADTASAAKRYVIVQESVGRSFMPVRFAAETFGFKVQWKSSEEKVILSNTNGSVEFKVGSTNAMVNGKQQALEAAPFNLSGTVYVPLRFAAESLGASVEWKKEGRIVLKSGNTQTEIEAVSLTRVERAVKNPVVIGNSKIQISTKSIQVNTVHIDLFHPTLSLDAAYANDKIGSTESLKKMAERSKAAVAVNGTFFNAYSTTEVQIPYGYIVKSGEVINKASGDERAIFVYMKTGEARIVDGEKELKELLDQDLVQSALQAGPRLVRNSKVDTNPVAEGFKDPKVLTNRAARTSIGVTTDGKLLIVTTSSATIKEMAEVMVKLGAVEAMNLDGGASSGLYANGKYITTPGRDLSNALVAVY